MVNLTAVSIGQNSVTIYWDIPSALHLFPPGLRYRVGYKIDMPWSDESLHVSGYESTGGTAGQIGPQLVGPVFATLALYRHPSKSSEC